MSIFKAYDIRGRVPDELDEKRARSIGAAFARFLKARTVAIGRDVRLSSPALASAFGEGVRDAGTDVVDIGLCTTPMTYFAAGRYGYDGAAMTTASHNPPAYNGFKLCREQAIPLSSETGIREIERMVAAGPQAPPPPQRGARTPRDIRSDYLQHVLSFARSIRPLRVAIDAANGSVGTIFADVAARLPITVKPLFLEPDGRFPGHEPNPLRDENLVALQALVRDSGADLGAAFDGDGDRCLFVDEAGNRVPNDLLTALIARDLLSRHPGAAIVYDIRSSWVVREEILRAGGKPIRERVGHAFIKKTMRDHRAVFGGELSGHAYFRDHYYADSGLIAFIAVLNVLSASRQTFSKTLAPLRRYAATGEVNFRVDDKDAILEEIRRRFADARQDTLDGLTIEYEDWWFNVRPSNTEPLLRLCAEAKTPERLASGMDVLLGILGKPG